MTNEFPDVIIFKYDLGRKLTEEDVVGRLGENEFFDKLVEEGWATKNSDGRVFGSRDFRAYAVADEVEQHIEWRAIARN